MPLILLLTFVRKFRNILVVFGRNTRLLCNLATIKSKYYGNSCLDHLGIDSPHLHHHRNLYCRICCNVLLIRSCSRSDRRRLLAWNWLAAAALRSVQRPGPRLREAGGNQGLLQEGQGGQDQRGRHYRAQGTRQRSHIRRQRKGCAGRRRLEGGVRGRQRHSQGRRGGDTLP